MAECMDLLTESGRPLPDDDLCELMKLMTEVGLNNKGIQRSDRAEEVRREVSAAMKYAIKDPNKFLKSEAMQGVIARGKAKDDEIKQLLVQVPECLEKAEEDAERDRPVDEEDESDYNVYVTFAEEEESVLNTSDNFAELVGSTKIVIDSISENVDAFVKRSKTSGHSLDEETLKTALKMAMKRTGMRTTKSSYSYFCELQDSLLKKTTQKPDELHEDKEAGLPATSSKSDCSMFDETTEVEESDESFEIDDILSSDEWDSESEVNKNTDKAVLKKMDQKALYQNGGSYKQVCVALRPTNEVAEVNHMPPVASYAGTEYEKINDNDKPAIGMLKRHHRNLPSTHSEECREILKRCLQKSFFLVFIAEMVILWTHKLIREYALSVRHAIEYCRSEIPGAPLRAGRNQGEEQWLITDQEYSQLIRILTEMVNVKFNDENMSHVEVWISEYESDENFTQLKDELINFLKEEPQTHADKRMRHFLDMKQTPKPRKHKRVGDQKRQGTRQSKRLKKK